MVIWQKLFSSVSILLGIPVNLAFMDIHAFLMVTLDQLCPRPK